MWAGSCVSCPDGGTGKRAAAEDAAFEARTQLARMARIHSLGELTASIAHEINQPLAARSSAG
ncbi:hypothetical protein [Achromobacter ruhlandii]|uniref:hypothetical protein n=1 Tax=Achromobacter ruhlandii TaxID=72557 RepID=UPI000ADDFD1C|nr:hypothetical protein [Achromobacter ruhlandii]